MKKNANNVTGQKKNQADAPASREGAKQDPAARAEKEKQKKEEKREKKAKKKEENESLETMQRELKESFKATRATLDLCIELERFENEGRWARSWRMQHHLVILFFWLLAVSAALLWGYATTSSSLITLSGGANAEKQSTCLEIDFWNFKNCGTSDSKMKEIPIEQTKWSAEVAADHPCANPLRQPLLNARLYFYFTLLALGSALVNVGGRLPFAADKSLLSRGFKLLPFVGLVWSLRSVISELNKLFFEKIPCFGENFVPFALQGEAGSGGGAIVPVLGFTYWALDYSFRGSVWVGIYVVYCLSPLRPQPAAETECLDDVIKKAQADQQERTRRKENDKTAL